MKLLYVLVSQPLDIYYEQALLSIMSAKYRMPEMLISLLMDEDTKKTLVGSRKKIFDYVDEFSVIECDPQMSSMIRSRFLKTMMREYVEGDFLYVDVDTLWVNPIDESDFLSDIMGVPDGHVEFEKFIYYDYHDSLARKLGFNISSRYYINGGVLFLRDVPVVHDFMNLWNKYWNESCTKGCCTDQQSLNYVNCLNKEIIRLLPHGYNVQIAFSIRYLLNAKLIHYFGTGSYKDESALCFELQKKSFWMCLKKSESQIEMLETIVKNPYVCFSTSSIIVNNEDEKAKHNPIYGFINDLIISNKKRARILLKYLNAGTVLMNKLFSLVSAKK